MAERWTCPKVELLDAAQSESSNLSILEESAVSDQGGSAGPYRQRHPERGQVSITPF
jgi:hypothetical protein